MIRAAVSTLIRHDPWKLSEVFADYVRWPEIFPRTVRGVSLLRQDGPSLTIEVDHRKGKVVNVLRVLSPDELELQEWKKMYFARFVYRFDPDHRGTLFRLIAEVKLKGFYRPLAPFAKPFIVHQIKRHITRPLKTYVEARIWDS